MARSCGRDCLCRQEPEARCESTHPERDSRCTFAAGHDTHRNGGNAWTTLDRLDGHVLVRTGDLAEVLAVASGFVTPGTSSSVIDRLNAALTEAAEFADDTPEDPR